MRIFLSHSSIDKQSYVNYIKEKLSSDEVIIDERSFKKGAKNKDEMRRLIAECDLFVVFISENSLSSENVLFEINTFKGFQIKTDKVCLPIIIDSSIKYNDGRIPQWIRENYNLRPILRPTKALAHITEEIRLFTWKNYDMIKKLDNIFRGRNDFINKFETHYSDRRQGTSIAYNTSGFEKIGRRSFLKFCFKKVGKIRPGYEFMNFNLTQNDSIEDFIFRMNELGVSPEIEVKDMINKPMEEKISIASTILSSYYDNNDVVLIYDNGCIIQRDGDIAKWFRGVLDITDHKTVGSRLAIASRYTYSKEPLSKFWSISLPELSPNERRWLLEDYLSLYDVVLTDDEFEICQNWLQGYPEQVFYLAKTLSERGFHGTRIISDRIVAYSLGKAETILQDYLSDNQKMAFLATLAKMELVKINDIIETFNNNQNYNNFLTELLTLSICTTEGVVKEYIRLSEVVRDYLDRKRFEPDKEIIDSLKEQIKNNFKSKEHGIPDASDLYFIVKDQIENNNNIDEEYIFPSHFARAMQDIYNRRKDDKEVIRIAEFLISKKATIDQNILNIAYYYFCLANARTKNKDLFKYISYLKQGDQYFIKGFYYRKKGRWIEAINEFKRSLEYHPNHKRAQSELVGALNRIGEYEEAFELAYSCYTDDPNNIYFAQEYFKCLKHKYTIKNDSSILEKMKSIIDAINPGSNTRDQGMLICMKANHAFLSTQSYRKASEILDSTPNSCTDIYILFTKFSIAERCHLIEEMKETQAMLEKVIRDKSMYLDLLTENNILILAHSGKKMNALEKIKNLPSTTFSDSFKQRLEDRVRNIM